MDTQNNILSTNFKLTSLLKFTAPTIIMMLFQGIYTIVDTIFISRFINSYALSAINIITPLLQFVVGLATMIATGGSAIIARKMGKGKIQEAKENFTLLTITIVCIGISLSILCFFNIESLLYTLGSSELLYSYCYEYIIVQILFIPINMLQVYLGSMLITAGKPQLGLFSLILSGILNMILDYIFIASMHLGMQGAAIATCIGYMTTAYIGMHFFVHNTLGSLHFCKLKMNLRVIVESIINGSSEMVSQLSSAITTILFNITIFKLLGEDGIAAITILIYSQFLLTSLYIGFSMGIAPIISYTHGNQNHQKLKHLFKLSLGIIIVCSIITFTFVYFFKSNIIQLFTSNTSNLYHITYTALTIFSFSFLCSGINIFTSSLFTALSNGKISALLSFLRTFVFITIGLLVLPELLPAIGIWLAIPLAELLSLGISFTCIYQYRNKYHYL